MGKYCGNIGFSVQRETSQDVWEKEIVVKKVCGDLLSLSKKVAPHEMNDKVTISNRISIIADPFVYNNLSSIEYVEFMGSKWKINNVDVQYPRLILSMGDLYNENE